MAAAVADLLAQGRAIHLLSAALCAGAMAALLLAPGWRFAIGPAAVLLTGLAGTWAAIRVGFDARCFGRLAEPGGPDLIAFDATMVRLGLVPGEKVGRAIEARIAGARRLLVIQGLLLVVQVTIAASAALVAGWHAP